MNSTFTCECCKGIFPKSRPEKEVIKEKYTLFPFEEDCAIVCEVCFIKIMDYNEPGEKRYAPFIDKENMAL